MPMLRNVLSAVVLASALAVVACDTDERVLAPSADASQTATYSLDPESVARGRTIFRMDTFGDETFWTDSLRMHEVIRTSVSPATALSVGLKVDLAALPKSLREALAAGQVNLNDPAVTVALLKLDAVVGLKGEVDASGTLTRVGITCALCHSTVDNSFAPGIGDRLDGWANRDLDPGKIISLSPFPTAAQKAVYLSWGPGMYDPRFNFDGQNIPVVIPSAFGLRHVAREIYTGDGPVSYWNAYVAITQMHGHGTFVDNRIGVSVSNPPDLVSSKLGALAAYQFRLTTPPPIPGTINHNAAARGRHLFNGIARCSTCHIPQEQFSDVNLGRLHAPAAVGQNPAYALRSATKLYRTTPLRGLWRPPQLDGPYFHDGSAPTLAAVVQHYVNLFGLTLTPQQKADLVEYLKVL